MCIKINFGANMCIILPITYPSAMEHDESSVGLFRYVNRRLHTPNGSVL